jgi:cyanophycin synthetase
LRILETRVSAGRTTGLANGHRLLVDLGVLEEFPSNTIPTFNDAPRRLLPTLEDMPARWAGAAASSPACTRARGSVTSPSTIALEFQNLAGTDVRHGKTRSAGKPGQYNCIFEYREEAVGLEAGGWRSRSSTTSSPRRPDVFFDFAPELERLIRLRGAPGVRAVDPGADRRGRQPRHPVHPARPPLARPVRARRPPAADPGDDDLADVGDRVDVASDKSLTNRLLDSAGLPVPRADVVDTEEAAVPAAKRLGFPCVVKPLDGNHGRGVHLDLRSEEAVRAAFHGALAQSRRATSSWRPTSSATTIDVSCIGGKVAAIAERVPASVHRRRRAHRPRAGRHREQRPAPWHRAREGA